MVEGTRTPPEHLKSPGRSEYCDSSNLQIYYTPATKLRTPQAQLHRMAGSRRCLLVAAALVELTTPQGVILQAGRGHPGGSCCSRWRFAMLVPEVCAAGAKGLCCSPEVRATRAGGLCCLCWRFVLFGPEVCAACARGLCCSCGRFALLAPEVCAVCARSLCCSRRRFGLLAPEVCAACARGLRCSCWRLCPMCLKC